MRAGCHARNSSPINPIQYHRRIFITGGGRGGMGTMAIVVAAGVEETIIVSNRRITRQEELNSDELVTTAIRLGVVGRWLAATLPFGRRLRIGAIIGKGRM